MMHLPVATIRLAGSITCSGCCPPRRTLAQSRRSGRPASEDVARATADFSFDERSVNETFDLGNPEPTPMLELAQMIFEIAQQKGAIPQDQQLRFEHLPGFADDVRTRVPSVDKAAKILGWQPTVKTREAVVRCVEQAIAGIH